MSGTLGALRSSVSGRRLGEPKRASVCVCGCVPVVFFFAFLAFFFTTFFFLVAFFLVTFFLAAFFFVAFFLAACADGASSDSDSDSDSAADGSHQLLSPHPAARLRCTPACAEQQTAAAVLCATRDRRHERMADSERAKRPSV